mmetsp:Transcript_47471/g.97017  ORF Transcript_47471/g.97017 Transcript_47471/m.97017 type:complete len:205 (-) Transcript_47471:846-1460(-)|eukprot:CAMPEP_0181305028 /NCGR_PEP_ID=MMETSP1101-20121128/9497_1 /TAXON_ID=46948 /ORGANISM="Rhodomonas abbreviata, Strain Caron Lab Isolate" /LENGTH=204 /DNA_ID=CAMNT_0023410889 /DNA_START=1631 /DNA_END=2245 /DNA_ORIENTATION=-
MPLQNVIRFEDYAPYQTFLICQAGMEVVTKKQTKAAQLHVLIAQYFLQFLAKQEDRPSDITKEMVKKNGKGGPLTGVGIWKSFQESSTKMRNILLPAWNSMIGPDGQLQSGKTIDDACLAMRQAYWDDKQQALAKKRANHASQKKKSALSGVQQKEGGEGGEDSDPNEGGEDGVEDDYVDRGPREMPESFTPPELKFFLETGAR